MFRGNRPAGSGEEEFLRVFTICGHRGHLGLGTSIMPSDFHFLVPESFHKKLVQIGKVVSEKIRFDLAVKKVKVTRGSSIEQTMISWSHQCYMASFGEIGPPFPEKKIFEGFLPYIGGHLCHVTSIMSSDFKILLPESFHKKVQISTEVSEKIRF